MDDTVRTTAGVDVGGTRVKAVLVRGGSVLGRHVEPTPRDVAQSLGPTVAGVLERLRAGVPDAPAPDRVGLVVPGLVDEAGGHGVWSANLGWTDLDLRGSLAGHLAAEVVVGHDVRAGLLAEHLLGAARGVDDVLFVPLGTGLAVALMTGGRVVRGGTWTGELGHLRVQPDGPACGCGRRGCLEAVAGATAVGRRWREAGRAGDASDVAAAVVAGDDLAARIWQDAVHSLAAALAPVIASAGTRLVVVGGGMAEAGPTLLDPLRSSLAELLPDPDGVAVVRAGLGEWAGAIGASHLEPAPDRATASVPVPDLP
ncbi:ROK family protein [Phycicoccus sonneratiae]|uniref:ROK family protein n=1 Tax=Phycicoccus sonneratiae TaxID=2807628 RepID=A0ABS2CMS9_9MICO|nr:ROK family protein [Phycicoccus sonneraticus]MBM6401189.1 ROK family protein [Phycicoccus sonneraticus]